MNLKKRRILSALLAGITTLSVMTAPVMTGGVYAEEAASVTSEADTADISELLDLLNTRVNMLSNGDWDDSESDLDDKYSVLCNMYYIQSLIDELEASGHSYERKDEYLALAEHIKSTPEPAFTEEYFSEKAAELQAKIDALISVEDLKETMADYDDEEKTQWKESLLKQMDNIEMNTFGLGDKRSSVDLSHIEELRVALDEIIQTGIDLSSGRIELAEQELVYNGYSQHPKITVYNGDGEKLQSNTHYSISIEKADGSDDMTIGTFKLTVTGEANYTGTLETTYKIIKADPQVTGIRDYAMASSDETLQLEASADSDQTITYTPETDAVSIDANGLITVNDADALSEFGNFDVAVTMEENEHYNGYSGSFTVQVDAVPTVDELLDISAGRIEFIGDPLSYNGETQIPDFTVYDGDGNVLRKDIDYRISVEKADGSDDMTIGSFRLKISGAVNYTGTLEGSYEIAKADPGLTVCGEYRMYDTDTSLQLTVRSSSDQDILYEPDTEAVTVDSNGLITVVDPDLLAGFQVTVTVPESSHYNGCSEQIEVAVIPEPEYDPDLSKGWVDLSDTVLTYDGTEQIPEFDVYDADDRILRADRDYTVSIEKPDNNDDLTVGLFRVTVTGTGKYSGTLQATFRIERADPTVTGIQEYSMKATDPSLQLNIASDSDQTMEFSTDTDAVSIDSDGLVTVTDPYALAEAGSFVVTVMLPENDHYNQSESSFTVTVDAADLPAAIDITAGGYVQMETDSYTYTGSAVTPKISKVMFGDTELAEGRDYEIVDLPNGTDVGGYSVQVRGIGNYTGTAYGGYIISPKTVTPEISLSETKFIYNGKAQTPAVTVKVDGEVISSDSYFVDMSSDSKAIGKYKVTVYVFGNYAGSAETAFKIVPDAPAAAVKNVSGGTQVSWKKVSGATGYIIYRNGKKVKTISSGKTVKWTDSKIKNGSKNQYRIVTVTKNSSGTFKSAASKAKTNYYLAKNRITGLVSKAKQKISVTWSKNSKASGYQISYQKAGASKASTVKVGKASTLTRTLSKLAGKKYTVKVRSYKTVGGKTYYSAWSAKKSVAVKK